LDSSIVSKNVIPDTQRRNGGLMSQTWYRLLIYSKKKRRGLLAHYTKPEPFRTSPTIGDSFFWSNKSASSEQKIFFWPAWFYGRSVEILNPEQTLLVPDLNASCSLVESSPYEKYLQWRREHPDAIA